MPLPTDPDLYWPPQEWAAIYERYREHAAWYSGDPNALADIYTTGARARGLLPSRHSIWRTNFDRFWARAQTSPWRRQMLHAPLAADIATTSADLLFAEQVDMTVEEAHQDRAARGAVAVQDRLDELIEDEGVSSILTEAAETAAALGGVYLRVVWNKDLEPDRPLLCRVDADGAVPEFWYSRLQAVTFWSQVDAPDGGKGVWRLLERHEPGLILQGLYEGNDTKLGEVRPLEQILTYASAPLVETGIEQLTAVYIPNMRPNRRWRDSPMGKSDYDGVESMMDALDETWTSWMRDLRLSRARLLVASDLFESQGKGKGAIFDLDQEVFEKIEMPATRDGAGMITPSQFAIRTQEHMDTATSLVEEIVRSSGYSASTFGVKEQQRGVTATEIISRERRSYVTRGKKISYWQRPLSEIMEALLAIDAAHFQLHEVFRPRMNWRDAVQEDPASMSSTVATLRQANAASTETLVRMVHDDWSDEEVLAEVQKILEERQPAQITSRLAGPQHAAMPGVPAMGGTHETMPAGATSGSENGSMPRGE